MDSNGFEQEIFTSGNYLKSIQYQVNKSVPNEVSSIPKTQPQIYQPVPDAFSNSVQINPQVYSVQINPQVYQTTPYVLSEKPKVYPSINYENSSTLYSTNATFPVNYTTNNYQTPISFVPMVQMNPVNLGNGNAQVDFSYKGNQISIQCNKAEKMKNIFQKLYKILFEFKFCLLFIFREK